MSVKKTVKYVQNAYQKYKKIGKRNEIQRYQCNNCGKKISIPKKTRKTRKFSFKEYVYHEQTLQNLATKYNKSIQWVHYKIKSLNHK